jgi:hypothetical protein
MRYPSVLAACLLLPQALHAQQAPERLLSAGTQIYLRWDGVEAQRAAYEKSALGKTLKGDLGKFLVGLVDYTRTTLIPLLKDQVDPKVLEELASNITRFGRVLGKHGFVMGIEVRKGEPVHAQATVIFPKAGAPPSALMALLRDLTGLANAPVKDVTIEGRPIRHLDGDVVHALWWTEGVDLVLVLGTEKPATVLKRMHGPSKHLTDQPLFKQLTEFKEFPTWGRGFVDVASLVKTVRAYGPEAGALVDDLGLSGLQSITFQSGFDGRAERSVLELHTPGERKGLLALMSRTTFKLADLPPLPTDLVSVSAGNLDLGRTYDVVTKSVVNVARIFDANAASFIEGVFSNVDEYVGVKIRDDLLGSLGERMITYDSPGDGPLGLGKVTLTKIKDAKKLRKALGDLGKAASNIPGVAVEMKQKSYRGATLHELHIGVPGLFYTPTYTIYKDWFVFSLFPQPVQGFVLRARGEVPAWQPGQSVRKTLEKMPDEFVGLSISDPRPRLRLVLSLLPTGIGLLNSFVPQAHFDVSLIPNADAVTRHLFPNVTVTTDDGKKVRVETRASLALPF